MNLLHTAEFYFISKLLFALLTVITIAITVYFKFSAMVTYVLFGTLFVLYIGSEYLVASDLNKKHNWDIGTYNNINLNSLYSF